jgi:diaminopimelate decarboxylase
MKKKLSNKYFEELLLTTKKSKTPFYFYDLDSLVSHLKQMEQAIGPDTKLWYACKANPMSAILKIFRNRGFGIDVASFGELDQVLRSGIKPQNIISTGPAKSNEYLDYFIDSGVETIVVESINQLIDLNSTGKKYSKKIKSLLRVQLEWDGGKSVLGGDEITPFGIGEKDWKKINLDDFPNINVIGLHAFQWGNLLEPEKLHKIWDATCERLKTFALEMNINLDVLDLGGGIGIPYDHHTPTPEFKSISPILKDLKQKHGLNKIWLELGRYAVGGCGHYFTKIVDVKKSRGKNIIVTDGGINHMARPALTRQPFPAELFSENYFDDDRPTLKYENYSIHGPLCTALDYLGDHKLPIDTKPGDWVVFHQAGAYGFTEAMPFFLCHDLPAEHIFYNGDFMGPRTSKTSADWMI